MPDLPAPPEGLDVHATVDGWEVRVTGPRRFWFARRVTLHILRPELRIDGLPGRRRLRIPWTQVDAPRVADLRDGWEQAWDAQFLHDDPHGGPSRTDKPRVGVLLRWTTDGSHAAYAHDLTTWDRAGVGGELGRKKATWVARAIEHMKEQALLSRQEAEFEDIAQGRPDHRAHGDLLDLLDGRDD